MQINKTCLGNVVDQHASLSRLQPGFESRPRRFYERFESFPYQLYEGDKAQGILIDMPTYFNKGAEPVKAADHRLEKLPEPNKQKHYKCLYTTCIYVGEFIYLDRYLLWSTATYKGVCSIVLGVVWLCFSVLFVAKTI